MTSGVSRISFNLNSTANVPVASCQVSVFANSIDSENSLLDSMVFCVSVPIDAYANYFHGLRHSSGDVSIWRYAVPTNSMDGAFIFRTFGNITMKVETYTNNTSIAAEMFSDALKTNGINEIIRR